MNEKGNNEETKLTKKIKKVIKKIAIQATVRSDTLW